MNVLVYLRLPRGKDPALPAASANYRVERHNNALTMRS
jgi:hypothetical protein